MLVILNIKDVVSLSLNSRTTQLMEKKTKLGVRQNGDEKLRYNFLSKTTSPTFVKKTRFSFKNVNTIWADQVLQNR